MKKVLVFLTIGSFLVLGGSMAFAATAPTNSNGNGFMMQNQVSSPEEALAAKIERIDDLVEAGRITNDQAIEFKAAITERMNNCDGTSDRESKERLGIGFGRLGDKGEFQGQGNRNGAKTR